jgi:hypothetical protein
MDHGAAHELIHWAAAVVLVVSGAVTIAIAARRRTRATAKPPPKPFMPAADRSSVVILASLSLGAAVLHLAAAPSHYVELGDLGAAFLVAATLQAAWARSLLAGAKARVVASGLVINGVIVGTWAVSRTIGLPVGPDAFVAEPVGLPDGAATAFELLLVAGLAARALGLDGRLARRVPATGSIAAVAVVPVLGLVLLTASLASLAIVAGAEHGAPPTPGAADLGEHAGDRDPAGH